MGSGSAAQDSLLNAPTVDNELKRLEREIAPVSSMMAIEA